MQSSSNKSMYVGNAFVFALLAISLLFIQSLQLHFHLYDHQHDVAEYNAHQSIPHSDYIPSEDEHHDEVVIAETLYYLSNRTILSKSLLSTVFLVFFLVFLSIFVYRRLGKTTNTFFPPPKRYSISPPLRAPPLH